MSLITMDRKTGKVLKIVDCPDDKMTQEEANEKYNIFLAEMLYDEIKNRGHVTT